MNKSIFAFFSLILITAAMTMAVFAASNNAADKKVVLVIADYIDVKDIESMEFLRKLAEKSHIALMNNRQTGKADADKSKLIIGSGKKLELDTNMLSGGSEEGFLNLYEIAGGKAPAKGSLVYPDIYKLFERNKTNDYRNYIGYLGEVINKNNGSVCFLGNSDTTEPNRSSMLLAMDSSGMIDRGNTDSVLKEDELFPYGRRTDYNRLADLYKQYLPASSFLVIETGDMGRLEAFSTSMSEVAFMNARNTVLKDIDSFMESLVSTGGFSTMIFISSYPSKSNMEKNNRLTPVIAYEADNGGLLYSRNTRRQGLVLNTDIADFIIRKLDYKDSGDIEELPMNDPLTFLLESNDNIARVSRMRTPVLTTYSVLVMVALTVLFVIAVQSGKYKRCSLKIAGRIIAAAILAFPAVLLYIPTSFTGDEPAKFFAYSAVSAIFISAILVMLLKNSLKMTFFVSVLLLAGLTVDIILGSPFIKQSVLGYDPEIGARFYGIGNEYAGMFAGSGLIALGSYQELAGRKLKRLAAILFYVSCTLILGLSFLGANFGGAVAGITGYVLAYFLVYGIKFSKRNVLAVAVFITAAAASLIIADSLGISSKSHMGRLVEDAGTNGIGVIFSTISRKIAMNLRLIRYTIWTKVLLTIITIIAFMFYKPAKMLQKLFERYKYMKCAWIGIAASSVTGFAVNDSGIVVAATAMIYVAFTMLLLCMGERDETGDGLQDSG